MGDGPSDPEDGPGGEGNGHSQIPTQAEPDGQEEKDAGADTPQGAASVLGQLVQLSGIRVVEPNEHNQAGKRHGGDQSG